MNDDFAAPRQISLTINIGENGTRCELSRVDREDLTSLTTSSGFTRREFENLLDEDNHRESLETVKNQVGRPVVVRDLKAATIALRSLHEIGRNVASELFGRQVLDVQSFLNEAVPDWNRGTSPFPLIEVRLRSLVALPLEILPLFSLERPQIPILKPTDLLSEARAFLGFSTILNRRILDGEVVEGAGNVSKSILKNPVGLPIRFYQYAGMEGARRELEFFKGRNEGESKWFNLDGPWPSEDLSESEFPKILAGRLWNDSLGQGSEMLNYEVHHFACHCDTTHGDTQDHTLNLSHNPSPGFDRSVTIKSLNKCLSEFNLASPGISSRLWPLVFLNACGSASIHPRGSTSFPHFFVRKCGNRGFIGTETRMPDPFAASFSEIFYTHLVSGDTVGESLLNARLELLVGALNPLGIFYTFYGDPYLAVLKPLQWDSL